MWFPKSTRIKDISSQIGALAEEFNELTLSQEDKLSLISGWIQSFARNPAMPHYQVRDWLWIASQIRLHPEDDDIRRIAGAALLFLGRVINSDTAPTEADIADLNWVSATSEGNLRNYLGDAKVTGLLSEEERIFVEESLDEYRNRPFDREALLDECAPHIEIFSDISNENYIPGIQFKIQTLCEALTTDGDDGNAAAAALKYLAEPNDVVPDTIGYLGLADDLFVIENAYAEITGNALWLPILKSKLHRKRYLHDIVLEAGDRVSLPSLYLQYILAVVCDAFDRSDKKHTLLILNETGPCALLGAFVAGIALIRKTAKNKSDTIVAGKPIFIGHGKKPFRAVYGGVLEHKGFRGHKIHIAQKGSCTISDDEMKYVRPSPEHHNTLSKHKDKKDWLKDHSPQPIMYVTGTDEDPAEPAESFLLVSKKKDLDEYVQLVKPLRETIPKHVGLRYITSSGSHEDYAEEMGSNPLIYACSNPNVAVEMIRDGEYAFKGILVDGAAFGFELYSALKSMGLDEEFPILCLAESADREVCRNLIDENFVLWDIADTDVEVPSSQYRDQPINKTDILEGFQVRQKRRHSIKKNVTLIDNSPYDLFHAILREMFRSIEGMDLTPADRVGAVAAEFSRRLMRLPVDPDENERLELEVLLRRLTRLAAGYQVFDKLIRDLYEASTDLFSSGLPPLGRGEKVASLLTNSEPSNNIGVLCGSKPLAEKYRNRFKSDPIFSKPRWLSPADIYKEFDLDTLIIPGWVDRMTMRRLQTSAFASRYEYIYLAFEKNWHERSEKADQRWKGYLSRKKAARFKEEARSLTTRVPVPKPQSTETDDLGAEDEHEGIAEFELIEHRLIEIIGNTKPSTGQGNQVVTGRLVVLDHGYYVYLAENARAICLNDVLKDIEFEGVENNDEKREVSEDVLLKKVSDLSNGDVLAFSQKGNRDLLDQLSDQCMEHPQQVRHATFLWKRAVEKFISDTPSGEVALSERLKSNGVKRHPFTVLNWTRDDHLIATARLENCNTRNRKSSRSRRAK